MDILEILKSQQINRFFDTELVNSKNFSFRWHAIGVLEIIPHQHAQEFPCALDPQEAGYSHADFNAYNTPINSKAVIISVGIHGNETAPIEILNDIIKDIFIGNISLQVSLLVILGNPQAILENKRYLSADMNRMFSGRFKSFVPSDETKRAEELETIVTDFYTRHTQAEKFHFDMHTAIRASHYPRFALLPYQPEPYNMRLNHFFLHSKLNAVVFHKAYGGTFSQFTTAYFNAHSCTLELGKAKPFGQNDLADFIDAKNALIEFISVGFDHSLTNGLSKDSKNGFSSEINYFKVKVSLIKKSEKYFQLHVKDDCPNFTVFHQGEILLEQLKDDSLEKNETHIERYQVSELNEWILFPNPKVALGLRAGMLLTEVAPTEAAIYFK